MATVISKRLEHETRDFRQAGALCSVFFGPQEHESLDFHDFESRCIWAHGVQQIAKMEREIHDSCANPRNTEQRCDCSCNIKARMGQFVNLLTWQLL